MATKNESNKGDSKGGKSFKVNPKDLERELIASKVKEGKRGYRTQLYELASQRIDFKSSTFYRLLEKFVKNLK